MPKIRHSSRFYSAKSRVNQSPVSSCSNCFWLVNIDAGHESVKLPPGQVPDLGAVSWPAVTSLGCKSFIDQNEPIRFFQDSFDPVPSPAAKQE